MFNDNNSYLKEMYEIIINEEKIKEFQIMIDNLVHNIKCKEDYQ